MKRKAPDTPREDDAFAYWADGMLPELRSEVRSVLHAQCDYATLTSLRMTSKREQDDTSTFFNGIPWSWRSGHSHTFITMCFRFKYWSLIEWGLEVYPTTKTAFWSSTPDHYDTIHRHKETIEMKDFSAESSQEL